MHCPTPEQLSLLLTEELRGAEAAALENHLETCASCQAALAELCETDQMVRSAEPVVISATLAEAPRADFLRQLCEAHPGPLAGPWQTPLLADDPAPNGAPTWPVVPGYEILRELGRGGMGVVYLARQQSLGRLVALKMILAGAHAGPQERARFRIEAEAVARLQHPNIVQIFEVGEDRNCPFLVLEHVEGLTLAQQVRGKPWPAPAAAELIATLALAVHTAHLRGIVHRDLKPGNILLEKKDEAGPSSFIPKITDFGLAKRTDGPTAGTATGACLGTPDFMAPEQAEGHEVGPPADIYALGAILYYLLTGRPPFLAATPLETLVRLRSEEVIAPSVLRPDLARDLETICLKCLDKEPARRYTSALELSDDLRRFLADEPIRARPTPAWERARKWVKRRPAPAALLVVSIVAAWAMVGGGVALWYNGQLKDALQETDRQRVAAETERAEARRLQQQAQEFEMRVRYDRDMNAGLRQWQVAQLLPLMQSLEAWRPTPTQPVDLRGWDWGYLSRLCHLESRQLDTPGTFVPSLAFSPDGKLLAGAAREGREVYLWDVASGRRRRLPGTLGQVECVAFSPDSRLVAAGSTDKLIRLWDARRGTLCRTLTGHTEVVRHLAFGPDGRRLASASMDGTVRLWDVARRTPLAVYEGHNKNYVLTVAFSPDGRLLASAGQDRQVHICAATDLKPLIRYRGHAGQISGLAFSPDGQTLASSSEDRTVGLWDTATGRLRRHFPAHDGWALDVAFTPDGRYLATSGDDGTVHLWIAATGKQVATFRHRLRLVGSLAIDPKGRWIATGSNDHVRFWPVTEVRQDVRILRGYKHPFTSLQFSPDSRTLVAASMDTKVRLWDAASGQEIQCLTGHSDKVTAVCFHPDGRHVISASLDGTIQIWNTATGKVERFLVQPPKSAVSTARRIGIECLALDSTGHRLASGGYDGGIVLWDLDIAHPVLSIDAHTTTVSSVAFCPDNRWLLSSGWDGTIKLWDARTGDLVRPLPYTWTNKAYAAVFSPDGRLVADCAFDGAILVDPATGKLLRSLRGHALHVYRLAFSPDGRRLASAGDDRTVRLWDVASGLETLRFDMQGGAVYGLAFSPNGRYLAAGGVDCTIMLWEADPLDK